MYLGHVVSEKGIQTDPKKVEPIWKWPIQTNVTEVCSFLGLTNYYSKFIQEYAQVAKPLYKLSSTENAVTKQNLIKWDQECQETFDKFKELCTSAPILAYADFKKLFRLHTDSRILGLGVVLYQEQDGVERLSIMPVGHYQNQNPNIQSINWNFSAQKGQ